jgi:hypothetical protein
LGRHLPLAIRGVWFSLAPACIAAALSKIPEEFVADTDVNMSSGESEVDAEFVSTLTKAHGALVAENGRCGEEVAVTRKQLERLDEEVRKRALQSVTRE